MMIPFLINGLAAVEGFHACAGGLFSCGWDRLLDYSLPFLGGRPLRHQFTRSPGLLTPTL